MTGRRTEVAARSEVTSPAEAPVLVTEQQVPLSTAAAAQALAFHPAAVAEVLRVLAHRMN
jgi:hypothetical protein